MQIRDIQTLYAFNSWANRRLLESLQTLSHEEFARDLGSSHGGIHGTLIHAMGAEDIWLRRWKGESPSRFYGTAEFPTLGAVAGHWGAVDTALLEFSRWLRADADIEAVTAYKDLKGNAYSQPLWQLMQHVVNHSTYHRGQIVTMQRQLGFAPTGTDLVTYYRLGPSL